MNQPLLFGLDNVLRGEDNECTAQAIAPKTMYAFMKITTTKMAAYIRSGGIKVT